MAEMVIVGRQRQPVLQGGSRQPEVVRRYRPPLLFQLVKNLRIKLGGFVVDGENINTRGIQKFVQLLPVPLLPAAAAKTGKQFSPRIRVDADKVGPAQRFKAAVSLFLNPA